jgi:hypothetical protein
MFFGHRMAKFSLRMFSKTLGTVRALPPSSNGVLPA